MYTYNFLVACLSILAPLSTASGTAGIEPFTNATVYEPSSNGSSVSYARTEEIPGNGLLAAWNDFGAPNSSMLIYRSNDDGRTWKPWGTCKSDKPGRRLVQPHLLYLDEPFGEEEGGVVLLSVNAADNSSTNIEVYASWNEGKDFEFVSRVATGGRANTTNGATPVWEPFLMRNGDRLSVYYSDQRDPKHGQKLVQQTTEGNFDSWGPVADIVASETYEDRPGMLIVTELPNGQFVMVFEYAMIVNQTSGDYKYPIYYKISPDAENADGLPWHRLVADKGSQPNGGPYATWSPLGGSNGTIIVSDSDNNPVWVNQALGEGIWREIEVPHGHAYSREVRIPKKDKTKLRIAGGAPFEAEPPTRVEVSVIDLKKALGIED